MRKLTHDEQVKAINAVNPNVEILGEITGNNKKVLCRCLVCCHEWKARVNDLKQGHGCPECKRVKTGEAKRKTHTEHVAEIAAKNPNVEVLGEIKNVDTKVLCRCKICSHEWMTTPDKLKQKHGCPVCAGNRKLSHAEHVAAIYKANPNVEVLGEIVNANKKVLCRCKLCGHEWHGRPYDLKRGCGCPKCAGKMKLSHTEQVEAIKKINPYIEILGEIKNNSAKVLCRCKACGHEWKARPDTLKRGHGCPRCAKYGFLRYDVGKLYIMVDDLEAPTMIKIGVSINEKDRSKQVLKSAHKTGVIIPALHVAKTWEGPTGLMQRIEQMMHENYEEWNMRFPAKFSGCTEFFYYTPETAGVFDVIEETLHEIINGNKAA